MAPLSDRETDSGAGEKGWKGEGMTTKQETQPVKLIYPECYYSELHVAEATVEARITPRQIVIERQSRPQVVYVNGHTRGPTGIGACRWWRHNGMRVGGSIRGSWQLADGELERLNYEASKREAER